jgi:hypothetical protein
LQATQTLMTGAFGQSTSTRMRDLFVVVSPKCRQQQISMQIWHSVHRGRLILIITSPFLKFSERVSPMLQVCLWLDLYHGVRSGVNHDQALHTGQIFQPTITLTCPPGERDEERPPSLESSSPQQHTLPRPRHSLNPLGRSIDMARQAIALANNGGRRHNERLTLRPFFS